MDELSRIRERIEGRKNPLSKLKQLIYKYPVGAIALGVFIICLLGWGIFYLFSTMHFSNIPAVSDNQSSAENTTVTIAYPEISNITVTNISQSTADINWTTDIESAGEIKYWIGNSDNSSIADDAELKLTHSIRLSGLDPDTTYYFTVKATSESGYNTTSENTIQFTTVSGIIPVSPEVGYMAPDFSLQDLEGNTVNLSDYKGKWLIISFWETGCMSCRSTLPHLEKYYQAMPSNKIGLISVNYKEKNKITLISLIKNWGITFPVLLDDSGTVSNDYKISGFPTFFVLDGDGIIQKVVNRKFNSKEEIEEFVNSVTGF
jgi:peroxiredoxin